MTDSHDELRILLGAYVLGGLDAADRARLEEHLEGCADCREELARYAPLPALLHRAGRPLEAAEPSPSTWDGLIAAARAERKPARRRARWIGLAAAAVLVLAIAAGVLAVNPFAQPGQPLAAVGGSTASGHGELEERPWGTAVSLRLDGLTGDERFVAWVVSTDGRREQAASWGRTPSGTAEVSGASSIPRAKVTWLRITTAEGRPLLQMRADQ